ncbi:HAD-IB family phosphatase [Horticoccus luteus]|uniref:phosphoserine phosphatase n=1 Tax=Horticoccus luteus TaxID=2862869 RepID=A0A8F9TZ34_9BACT|nr:HAD-IB family phosphatase [Horticoccus luteus]QYM80524.1 HAD-IB family phosphatase [Horticoccus luteus]
MPHSLIVFDCDSTLSAIEGVDELGRKRGPEVLAAVEAMTNDAMEGRLAVEAVFGRRLEIIRPRRDDVAAVGQQYIATIEPTAIATISALAARGWTSVIVSGGFRQAIAPLAGALGVARVEAVDLFFDERGEYRDFDRTFPTARSGGKAEIMTRLCAELAPRRAVMVGDGVSDLEAKPVCDLFVGFGRYVQRARVKKEAGAWITSLDALVPLLAEKFGGK